MTLFSFQGAHVLIFSRRQSRLAQAVRLVGRNVTAIDADAANFDDLDRCPFRNGK